MFINLVLEGKLFYSKFRGLKMKKNILLLCLCLLLFGCGSNLLEQEDELVTADTADTPAEWAAIAEGLESTINSSDSTTEEIEQARVDRAAALLAKNDLSLLQLAENLAETSSDEENTDNLISLLNADANLSDVDTAAQDLNSVNTSGSLTESEQITRGMANTFAVSERVSSVFDVANDGQVSSKSGDNFNDLNSLLQPNDRGNSIIDFASNAQNAFNQTDSLSDEQDTEISDFVSATTELQTLNNVAQNGGTFSKNGQDFTFQAGSRAAADQARLEEAIELVLGF